MPDVSVIVPCHNAGAFLADAVSSVQRQTGGPAWQLLIVDDGSSDESGAIAANFAATDKRIRVVALPTNGGVAAARNAGIDASDSRYIAFLDADDLWLPEKLRVQTGRMLASRWCMSFTGYRRFRSDTGVIQGLARIPERMTYRRLLGDTAMVTSTIMLERAFLSDRRFTPGVGHEDFALWLELLRDGATAHGLRDDLARYRVVANSLSSQYRRSAGWVWHIQSEREKLPRIIAASYFLQYAARAAIKRLL